MEMPVKVLTPEALHTLTHTLPPPPPSPVRLQRCSGTNPTMADSIVQKVLSTCRAVDGAVKLVNMTRDAHGNTHLRVRAGDVHSLESLRRALQDSMPLSQCTVQESWLDGTLEAEVTVYTAGEEYKRARALAVKSRWITYPLLLAWVLLFTGLGEWAAAIRAAASNAKKDEL